MSEKFDQELNQDYDGYRTPAIWDEENGTWFIYMKNVNDSNNDEETERVVEEVALENRTLNSDAIVSVNVQVKGRSMWVGYRLEDKTDVKVTVMPRGGGTSLGGPELNSLTFIDKEDSDRGGNLVPEEYLPAEVRIDVSNRGAVDTTLRSLVVVHKL